MRDESRIMQAKEPKLPEWELVDEHGNRLDDETVEAKTAGEAALEFFRRSGNNVRTPS